MAVAGDEVLLGDAWRGVHRPEKERAVRVPSSGTREPVGAVWVHATGDELCALDSVGRLWRLVDGALEPWSTAVGGRIRALASRDSEPWFLVADDGRGRWTLWRGDTPTWTVEGSPTAAAGLSLLDDAAIVWGLSEAPLKIVLATGQKTQLADRRGARLVAPVDGGSVWAVERSGRDLLWLDRADDEAILLDLGEPLEVADDVFEPTRLRALVPRRGGVAFSTDAGTFALRLDGDDPARSSISRGTHP